MNKLSGKDVISFTLLSVVIILIPVLKMFYLTKEFFTIASVVLILLLSAAISLSKLPRQVKIGLLGGLLIFYRRNILLLLRVVYTFYQVIVVNPISKRPDDALVREYVHNTLSKSFNMVYTGFDKLPKNPGIILCNYISDRVENIACILFPIPMTIVMRDWLRNFGLHKVVKNIIYTYKGGNNFERTKSEVSQHLSKGNHVFSYINKFSGNPKKILSVKSGMLKIAQSLGVPVTLVAVDFIYTSFGVITPQKFELVVGDTFEVKSIHESKCKIRKFFSTTLERLYNDKLVN